MGISAPKQLCAECGDPVTILADGNESYTALCAACGASYGVELQLGPDGEVILWPQFRIVLTGDPNPCLQS